MPNDTEGMYTNIEKEHNRMRLRRAASLVETVMESLDLTEIPCDHCKRVSHTNWDQAQAHKELDAIARKLKRFAKSDVFKG
jgi:hypothetical protein